MAERNPGPVKPPTIDLVAREATPQPSGALETPAAETPAAETPAVEPKRPRARKARTAEPEIPAAAEPMYSAAEQPEPPLSPELEAAVEAASIAEPPPAQVGRTADWGQIGAAAVIGALFGTALTYIVATIVPMPSRAPLYDDPTPALTDQSARLGALEQQVGTLTQATGTLDQRVGSVEDTAMKTQVSLDATITQLDSSMTTVREEIAKAAATQPPAVDTSAIDDRLRALSARLDAVAAGASSADAGALAENLSDLEQALATLRTEMSAIGQRADAANTGVTTLEQSVAALETHVATLSPAPPPGPSIGEVALNGLEAAFAAGRPYSAELEALTRIAPDAAIPEPIVDAARTGLPAPDLIVDRFAAIVPDMLSANRPPPDANWQDTAANWLTDLLAIRPSGDVAGNDPDAIMARLEGAMERRDFVAADALFAQLPAEMRTAAGAIPADVALHAQAAGWIETLRKRPVEVTP